MYILHAPSCFNSNRILLLLNSSVHNKCYKHTENQNYLKLPAHFNVVFKNFTNFSIFYEQKALQAIDLSPILVSHKLSIRVIKAASMTDNFAVRLFHSYTDRLFFPNMTKVSLKTKQNKNLYVVSWFCGSTQETTCNMIVRV